MKVTEYHVRCMCLKLVIRLQKLFHPILRFMPYLFRTSYLSCENVRCIKFSILVHRLGTILSPNWPALDFWKIEFEKSSWTNLFFGLFRTWFLLPTKIKIDKTSSSSNWIFFKNQCRSTRSYFSMPVSQKASATEIPTFYQPIPIHLCNLYCKDVL